MAAALVGGSFLSAFLQVLFDRIASPNILNFISKKKLDGKLLKRLKTTLYAVSAVLNDAEQKQIKDPAVKSWLDNLIDAVYDADDLLDEISTMVATQKEVVNFFSRSLNLYDRETENKIEEIISTLELIVKDKDILGLQKSGTMREKLSLRPQSTSLVEEFNVYGRDSDKEVIIKLLLSDDRNDSKISVIPIVGMGGIGKTTLAQVAYNNDQVKQKFDPRAWVCVSEDFDVSKITKSIIESVTSNICDVKDLDLLQLELKEKLSGKKFLIVLDDIWNENYVYWDLLQRPFQYATEGSKILLTTRCEKVASVAQTLSTYRVGLLSDEDSWLIFANHACLHLDSVFNSDLERIGRDIVKKCKGLPLVAKTLGGLLRLKHDIRDWNNILNSDMWDLSENESGILLALRTSYHYLSPHLKQCFLYCSMFPKDYEFEKNELILLWMAEGFLESPIREKTLEEVGDKYFHDLVSRSFFQPLNSKDGCYIMHDLVHDLAKFEARKFYTSSSNKTGVTSMTRHLFYQEGTLGADFKVLSKAKSLRTFITEKYDIFRWCKIPPIDQLLNLKRLRVLSVRSDCNFMVLPESVNELIHLRYLNLSYTRIKKLPETLCDLCNLQTLILAYCECLTMLPNAVQKLVNLRYLDVCGCKLEEMPRGISKLKNLQFLSDFVIGKDQGASIKELGELQNLQKSLTIKNLQHVTNGVEALEARLIDRLSIESLSLRWYASGDIIDSLIERDILGNLHPHVNLKFLCIYGYGGTRFPEWIGHPLYYNMTSLFVDNCKNCCLLPTLGQLPSLKSLEIKGFDAVVNIGAEFYKNSDDSSSTRPFTSLEYLKFSEMFVWQEWCSDDTNAFPQLRQLTLEKCPRLSGDLPKNLPALETLRISGCEQLASPIPSAPAIHELDVEGCRKLEFPEQCLFGSLKSLTIEDSYDSLTSLPLDSFPDVQILRITGCENLKSILNSNSPVQYLQGITLCDCPSFSSFPKEGLFAPSMTYLEVEGCHNLKSLPDRMNSLTKLQDLFLQHCEEIEWLPEVSFPPNLSSLKVDHCVFARLCHFMDWHSFNSLTSLKINGSYDDSVLWFPGECFLPASLTSLNIEHYSSLEMLDCKGFLHLSSLRMLVIEECPKLEKITGPRLPNTLTELSIHRCPLLREQCRMRNAEIWPKIFHIPVISVDTTQIL